jgi:hypothetical protein
LVIILFFKFEIFRSSDALFSLYSFTPLLIVQLVLLDVFDATESLRRLHVMTISLQLSFSFTKLDADVDLCCVVFTGVFAKDLRILVGVVDLDDLPNVSLKSSDSFCFFKRSFISFSKIKPAVSERSPDLFFILRGVVRVVGVDNGIMFLINGVADVDLGVCFENT